jgi:hypothetical protein
MAEAQAAGKQTGIGSSRFGGHGTAKKTSKEDVVDGSADGERDGESFLAGTAASTATATAGIANATEADAGC